MSARLRSSPPVNWIRELGEYQNREAERVMGYRFERPSNRGVIVRKPTDAERAARDTHIEALREERGERASNVAGMNTDAYFAAKRVRAVAALARCAARKRGSWKARKQLERSASGASYCESL
jgi:hypothetical protein